MTTTTAQSTQLSNNTIQPFKLQLDQTLILNNVKIISRKEDGYINVTELCKSSNKLFSNWKQNKTSEGVIKEFISVLGIPRTEIIKVKQGGSNQGTYVHPQLAIVIAQWVSPEVAVRVSKWIFELMITGYVTLGQEKTNNELNEIYNKKIQSLQTTIETVVNENLTIKSTYSHLAELHDQLRMKRNYHKFKKGNCIYIITDQWREKDYLKIGYTDNINARLRTYRTSMPDVKIEFLLYLTENKVLEKCLKLRYASKLVQKNHEYVIDATVQQLVKSINTLTKYLSIETTEEIKLSLYNEPYKIYNLVFVDQNGNVEDNTDPIELDSPDEKNDNESNTETEPDPEPEVYKCDICAKEYKMKGPLENHMIKVHNQGKDEKDDGKTCHICKKVFREFNCWY
jgi:hypothetical protein